MEKISVQVVISSIRSRRDMSLGFSAETPELSDEEKVKFMGLQNQVLQAIFIPVESPDVPEYKVNKDLETKTPSQRLRASLYILHQQTKPDTDFQTFYTEHMEKIIQFVKDKLES